MSLEPNNESPAQRQVNFAPDSTPEAKPRKLERKQTPFSGLVGGARDATRPPAEDGMLEMDLSGLTDHDGQTDPADRWKDHIPHVHIHPDSIPDSPAKPIRRVKTPGPGLPVWNNEPRVHIHPDSIPDHPARPIRRVKTPLPGVWPGGPGPSDDENRVQIAPEFIPDYPAKALERTPTPVFRNVYEAHAEHADQLTKVWGEKAPDADLDRLEISRDLDVDMDQGR